MLERLRRMFEHYRDLAEVSALSDRDLMDLGVSRDQAMQLASLPDDVPGRVAAMGKIFGIPEDDLHRDRATWQELLAVCHQCRELRACRSLMDRAETATPGDVGFCPNWTQFAEFERHA
jgi:hypothetical protein